MVHTLLPADAESDSFQSGTEGEYFLATVNPGSDAVLKTIWIFSNMIATFLTLASLGWGQTCPGSLTASNNWCGPYYAADTNCYSGTGTGDCPGGDYNTGWWALDSAGTSYPTSLSAYYINQNGAENNAGIDVVPNTAVGTYQ